MGLKEEAYSVLIVSSVENLKAAVTALLPRAIYEPVVRVNSVAAAERAVAERSFDFIIINSPLPDSTGVRFAIDSSTSGNAIVLLLVKNDIHAEIYEKVSAHGVFTLPKPMSKQAMETALRWIKTAKERIKRFEKKTTSIEDRMKEIRLVNKAKWLLISAHGMDEPAAHRYLEKEAMDRCISKKEVAEEIIKQFS